MTRTPGPPDTSAPGAGAAAGGWWEDPIDVVFSPFELFDRRRHARLLPPLLILVAASLLLYLLMIPATDAIMRAAVADNPEAAAAIDQYGMLFRFMGALFVPVGVLVGLVWTAFLLWGFGRLFDIGAKFDRAMLVATYAGWILVLAQLVAGLLLLAMGGDVATDLTGPLSFGVLRFVNVEELAPAMIPLLGRLDIFAVWQAVVWGIGLYVMFRASRVQAAGTAAAAWLLAALPQVLWAMFRNPA